MSDQHKLSEEQLAKRRAEREAADKMTPSEIEEFIERARKKSDEYLGPYDAEASAKSLARLEAAFQEFAKNSFSVRYPEADGCGEVAILMEDKSILLFVTLLDDDGEKLCWNRDYKPGSAKYDAVFKAHKFDTPEAVGKRKHEFVTQYFPGTGKPPVDLAEDWE